MAMSTKKKLEVPRKPTNMTFKRALFAFESSEPDELCFKEGDLLYIIDWKSNPDWWTAKLKDKKGLVPANYFTPIPNDDGVNPFLDACRRGNAQCLEDCLSMRVPINFQDITGNSGLHYAAKSGHLDILERLLRVPGIRSFTVNREGDTPLHKAASSGRTEICQRLLQIPGCPSKDTKNASGFTPYELTPNAETKAVFLEIEGHKIRTQGGSYSLKDYERSDSEDEIS
uniref:Osteoclast-stimulating factor 1 n=1 Tax=Caligus rogercresseyi TaxID=217165 RepID=C1BND9_CALRO|nr:Osteoclast-stimulating factor 1 [Caligus rogercresseyi]